MTMNLSEILYRLSEVERRIDNICRIGTIFEADYEKAKVRVKTDTLETDWLPWLTQRSSNNITWHCPEVGEQVLLISPAGELNQAVVIPALYQTDYKPAVTDENIHQTQYSDGTICAYDRTESFLSVTMNQGTAYIKIPESTVIESNNVLIKGNLHVEQNITGDADVSDSVRTMSGDRDIYNPHTHTGDSGQKTQPPDQKQ